MIRSTKRRLFGTLGVVVAAQLMTACVVVPVPTYRGAVVVQPGYSGPPPPQGPYRDYDRRRDWRR